MSREGGANREGALLRCPPSGVWRGWWRQALEEGLQRTGSTTVDLTFQDGKLTGSGIDDEGCFSLQGDYSANTCHAIQQAEGRKLIYDGIFGIVTEGNMAGHVQLSGTLAIEGHQDALSFHLVSDEQVCSDLDADCQNKAQGSSAVVVDPPGGGWEGYWKLNVATGGPRGELEHVGKTQCRMCFQDGVMVGHGDDEVGAFTMDGVYDPKKQTCRWTKQYVGQHAVEYEGKLTLISRGFQTGHVSIDGTWTIPGCNCGSFTLVSRKKYQPRDESESRREPEPRPSADQAQDGSDAVESLREPREPRAAHVERCSICLCNTRNSVFLWCGHQVACIDCAAILHSSGQPCPVCRQSIGKVQRVYF
eukprot:evm.model.scf_934EXC.9 EVM.evm.TU.scf_934EXC.9   scf_934EXC:50931-53471(-)